MLPQLFEMDDYSKCLENNDLFCKVRARMTTFGNSTLKEYVKNLTKNMDLYDRSLLQRGLCITKPQEWHESYVRTESEKIINQRIEDFQITINVEHTQCTDGNVLTTSYDYFILCVIIMYSTFVAFSTYYERRQRNGKEKSGIQRLIQDFSIIRNWGKKISLSKNQDFQNLQCMQGIRGITMIFIICGHTALTYYFVYLSNPADFELIVKQSTPSYAVEFGKYGILHFFLLSSWLLTIQVNDTVKKCGGFSLKHIGIMIVNRYFRLIPTAGFIVVLYSTSWPEKIFGGPLNFDILQRIQGTCQSNFIYDLLFLQNYLGPIHLCNPVSWYLAADFQLYILNMLVMYIWFKYKFNTIKYFATVFVTSLAIYASVLYSYDTNGSNKIKFRNLKMAILDSIEDPVEVVTNSTVFSLFSASLIGTIFGIIYIQYKNTTFKRTLIYSVLWFLVSLGLTQLAVLLKMLQIARIPSAVLGSISRPIYSLGIAILIFGICHNVLGILRKCLEYRYLVILGNFTFGPYICQWILLFSQLETEPFSVHMLGIVIHAVILILKASFWGTILSLTIEEPGLTIQRRILPQIRKPEEVKKMKELI